jgi:hypothetical protein
VCAFVRLDGRVLAGQAGSKAGFGALYSNSACFSDLPSRSAFATQMRIE